MESKKKEFKGIYQALIHFQNICPNIELNSSVSVKTKSGGNYGFKYATLGHILERIQPSLKICSLGWFATIDDNNNLTTTLIHESGEKIESQKSLDLANGATAQEVGSAITYYKRYSLVGLLGIVAEDDEDGNIATGNTAKKREISIWASKNDVVGLLKLVENGEIERAKKGLEYWQTENRGISNANKKLIEDKL